MADFLTQLLCAIICDQKKVTGTKVNDACDADGISPDQVHVVMVAIDYKGTKNQLTCTKDGRNMQKLCSNCGVRDVTVLYDNDAHYAAVENAIRSAGSRCGPGDYLVLYYSGHGTSVDDIDGDEDDGKDEALCLVTPEGKLNWKMFMTDDQLSEIVCSSIPDSSFFLCLADCCHSGSICDFDSADWGDHQALSISGCTDSQTSGDTGNGGIFTHSMLMGLSELVSESGGTDPLSCGAVYNATIDKDDSVFDSKQDITLAWSSALGGPGNMVWPLTPSPGYSAPMD